MEIESTDPLPAGQHYEGRYCAGRQYAGGQCPGRQYAGGQCADQQYTSVHCADRQYAGRHSTGIHYTVGLAYNLKKGIKSDIEDIEAEYDSIETVNAIKQALEELNMDVRLLEADNSFITSLARLKLDIVFNIAEGMNGRGREAHIPAILNFLGIPFTGSDETTLCIALDKALTKRVLSAFGVKTPRFQLVEHPSDYTLKQGFHLNFPLIVKPNCEGSGKGISDFAIVENNNKLRMLIEKNCGMYRQPMLIEEYIEGREFTVGIIGNGDEAICFTPMEIKYIKEDGKYNIYSYNVKKNYKEYVEYICPPPLEKRIINKMTGIAKKVYNALSCKDFSRIDFRMSSGGEVYFLEINPLPGLAPGYSDFPMIGEFHGIGYGRLIKMVLNSALKRYGMETVE